MKMFRRMTAVFAAAAIAVTQLFTAVYADNEGLPVPAAAETEQYNESAFTEKNAARPSGASDEELGESISRKLEEALADQSMSAVGVPLTAEEVEYAKRALKEAREAADTETTVQTIYRSAKSVYGTSYFYDQLSSEGKQLYDGLYSVCQNFLSDFSTEVPSVLDFVDCNIPINDARVIFTSFYYSNPQFFFLSNGYTYYSYAGKITSLAPGINAEFSSGSTRKYYSDEINKLTASWLTSITAVSDVMARQEIIYKNLCDRITYTFTDRDQSIAGALVDKACVCNGYALSTEYFCNAAGIDCITVISPTHAWNIIKLYGNWYEFDVTWMDTGYNGSYDKSWLNKSYSTFRSNDPGGDHNYDTTAYTLFSLPECTSDTVIKNNITVQEVSMYTYPAKTAYAYGEAINISGGQLRVVYSDSTYDIVDITADMVSGFDPLTPGTQNVSVNYKNVITKFPVTVFAKNDTPYALNALTGFTSVDGITVPVTDSDHDATVIIYGRVDCLNTASLLDQLAETGFAHNRRFRFIYADCAQNSLDSVKAYANSHDSSFIYCYDTGSGINNDMWGYVNQMNGGSSSGTQLPVTVIISGSGDVKYIFSGPNTAENVYKYISYFCDDMPIFAALGSISLYKLPTKRTYIQGDALDLSGAVLKLDYGSIVEYLSVDEMTPIAYDASRTGEDVIMYSGYDPAVKGTQTITVYYGGKTATFTVTVKELAVTAAVIKNMPKTEFFLDDPFTVSGGTLTVTYNNGTTADVPFTAEGVTIDSSRYKNTAVGTYLIRVTIGGKSVTYNVNVSVDPNNAAVILKCGSETLYYDSLKAALATITSKKNVNGDYTIIINKTQSEKTITFPAAAYAKSLTIVTTGSAELRTTMVSIVPNSSLTLDANIVHVDAKEIPDGKKISVRAAANSTLTINRNFADLGGVSGITTSTLNIYTDAVLPSVGTFAAVNIASGRTLTLTGKMTAVKELSGKVILSDANLSAATVTNIGTAEFVLVQGVDKKGADIIPKLTVTDVTGSLTIDVTDSAGNLIALDSGTPILTAGNAKIEFTDKTTIANTTALGFPLKAFMYTKDVRAEYPGAMTVNGTDYPNIEQAFAHLNATGNNTIVLHSDIAPAKFTLPTKIEKLTIMSDGAAKTITLNKVSSLAPTFSLTLDNVNIVSSGAKALTINGKKDITLNDCSITPSPALIAGTGSSIILSGNIPALGAVSGTKTSSLFVSTDVTAASITTFGNVTVAAGKTLTIPGRVTAVTQLDGTLKITSAARTTTAAITNIGSAKIILTSENGVTAKTTISNVITNLALEIVDTNGNAVILPSGASVLTSGTTTDFAGRITVVNKDGDGHTLGAFMYTRDIRAEYPGAMTVNGTDYPNFEQAFSHLNATGNNTIVLHSDIAPAKFTLPAKIQKLTITSDGATRTITLNKVASLAPSFSLTLDNVNIVSSDAKSFTIAGKQDITLNDCSITPAPVLKAGTGYSIILSGNIPALGAVSGTKTSSLFVNTDVTAASISTFGNVTVTPGRILTTPGKVTAVTQLDGTLKISDAASTITAAITNIGSAKIILTRENGVFAKTTISNVITNLDLEIVDKNGNAVSLPSGTPILTAGSTSDFTGSITITNKDTAAHKLDAFLYKKEIRAEYADILTVSGNGINRNYPNFETAINAINDREKATKANAAYTVTLNGDTSAAKLVLPTTAGSLTIKSAEGVKILTLTTTATLAAKYDLTLKDIRIVNLNAKNVETALTLSQTAGTLTIDNLICNTLSAVRGSAKSTLDLGKCSSIDMISGFGTVNIYESTTVGKTFSVTNLNLASGKGLIVPSGKTIIAKELYGAGNSFIKLENGFKALTISGTAYGTIKLISDAPIADTVQIFTAAKASLSVFDVTGIAPADGLDYALTRTGAKVYCKAAKLGFAGKKFVTFADIAAEIETVNNNAADYTVTVLADYNNGAALKLPKAGTYNSLTITSDGKKFSFTGGLTLTGNTTFSNIDLSSVTVKGVDTKYVITGAKNGWVKAENSDLGLVTSIGGLYSDVTLYNVKFAANQAVKITAKAFEFSAVNGIADSITADTIKAKGNQTLKLLEKRTSQIKTGMTDDSGRITLRIVTAAGADAVLKKGTAIFTAFKGTNFGIDIANAGASLIRDARTFKVTVTL